MNDIFDLDDSEFTDIEKEHVYKAVHSPIIIATTSMRGTQKISLSFAESAIARLNGWPRFNLSWNQKNYLLRIRASTEGKHEAFLLRTGRPGPEKRYILRIPLQTGLKYVAKLREPAPHKFSDDNQTVNIQVPPVFRIEYARPGVPALQPGEKLTPERIKDLVPAPKFK